MEPDGTPAASNPFAPPETLAGPRRSSDDDALPFVSVPGWKIGVLMPLTFGLYSIYWMFVQYRRRRRLGADVIPWARALFQVFFTHRLMADVRDEATQAGMAPADTASIATLYVVLVIVENVYSRVTAAETYGFMLDLGVPVGIALARGLVLVRAQAEMNRVLDHVAPDRDRGERIGAPFIVAVVVFGALWLLILIGYMLPA
jgi:hypothetical protein